MYTAAAVHVSEANVPHQVVFSVFGAEHAGHFFEVCTVALFLHTAWEGYRYDPLCDVHQVHLIVLFHRMDQTHAPARQRAQRKKKRKIGEGHTKQRDKQWITFGEKSKHAIKPEI